MSSKISIRERKRLEKMTTWERNARAQGFHSIAGCDEAGRGPLAGPVVAAACIIPENTLLKGINDSKQLLPEERDELFQKIISTPEIDYGIGIIDAAQIDEINIFQASMQAMLIAMSRLKSKPDYILIDGKHLPTLQIPGEAIVEGDSRSQSIAAASILAKETRDKIMQAYHQQWPQYNFAGHKGYSTEEHLIAIDTYGPCLIHRMTFDPLRTMFAKEKQLELFREKCGNPS